MFVGLKKHPIGIRAELIGTVKKTEARRKYVRSLYDWNCSIASVGALKKKHVLSI